MACRQPLLTHLTLPTCTHILYAENREKGITQKRIRHMVFWPWGIQTGPFGACWADFVPKIATFSPFILVDHISYYPGQREERKEGAGAENGNKEDAGLRQWDTGFSDPGAFKLDHLEPVELILFQKIFTFLPIILKAPISNYPREKEEGRSNGEKGINQGNHPKGFSGLWAFKLDQMQPVRLILLQKTSTYSNFHSCFTDFVLKCVHLFWSPFLRSLPL